MKRLTVSFLNMYFITKPYQIFYIAGFGAVSHKLVLYPEFQERVYEEIIEVMGDGEVSK